MKFLLLVIVQHDLIFALSPLDKSGLGMFSNSSAFHTYRLEQVHAISQDFDCIIISDK